MLFLLCASTGRKSIAEKVLLDSQGKIQTVLFSPGGHIKEVLLDLISRERCHISVAMYLITDLDIAHALIAAHDRGIEVEVVTCSSRAYAPVSKVPLLIERGVTVYIFPAGRYAVMHHKFIVCKESLERSICITGSFNCTRSAAYRNKEDIIVMDDAHIVRMYEERFAYLTSLSKCISATKTICV